MSNRLNVLVSNYAYGWERAGQLAFPGKVVKAV
jgi:hypothetical protein